MTDENLNIDSSLSQEQKSVPQTAVTAIVMREREDAANRARREAEAEFQDRLKSVQPVDKEALFAEWEARSSAQNAAARAKEEKERTDKEFGAIKNSYYSKLNSSSNGKGEDFDRLMKDFPHEAYPALMIMSNNFDNTSDIMEYLADNPVKADELDRTAQRNYNGALRDMKKISETLAVNTDAAEKEPKINAPLSRNKSNIAGVNNDSSSWEAIKSDSSLRL